MRDIAGHGGIASVQNTTGRAFFRCFERSSQLRICRRGCHPPNAVEGTAHEGVTSFDRGLCLSEAGACAGRLSQHHRTGAVSGPADDRDPLPVAPFGRAWL